METILSPKMYCKKSFFLLLLFVICLLFSCSKGNKCSESPKNKQLFNAFQRISNLYTSGNASEMKHLLDSIQPFLADFSKGDTCQQRLWLKYLHARMVYYAQFTPLTDSMIFYGRQAKDMSFSMGDGHSMIQSISNLADAYRQKGDICQSISLYDDGIRLNDSIHADSALYLPLYSGMACSFNVLHNSHETDKWLQRMLSLSHYMTVTDSISYFTMKGNSLYFARKYKESLEVFRLYDSLLMHHPDLKLDRIVCDVDLADNLIHLHRDSEVGSLLDSSLTSLKQAGITSFSPYIHTLQILHLLNLGRNAEALKLVQSTIAEVPNMNPDHRVARYDALALCFEANNHESEADRYEQLYYNLNDSLRNIQTIAFTNEIENRYSQDSQAKQHKIEMQHRNIHELHLYLYLSILAFILLALSISLFLYRRRAHKRYYLALERINALHGKILRNKLTPEFISTALSLGHSLSDEDRDNIVTLIHESLAIGDSLTTSLSNELALANSYISVASMTQEGVVTSTIHIDSELSTSDMTDTQIPAMSLLTMVGKALKYGVRDADNKLNICINICREDNTVVVSVINPGHISDMHPDNKQAMEDKQMLTETIDLVNGHNHKQHVTFHLHNSDDGKHVKAILKITTF